jgi:hypothetical protein
MSLTLYIENGEISQQMGKGFTNPSNFPFYIGEQGGIISGERRDELISFFGEGFSNLGAIILRR